ncbi:hypothetical protein SPHINGO361_70067 [Sphingomonas sp. EC-HK361]|nr:hypothetical protein SPHINGO361_70067 [Sphingomonas sp. EC-HK361]
MIGLGVLAGGLNRERAGNVRVSILAVASRCPRMLKSEGAEQTFEVPKSDRRTAVGE